MVRIISGLREGEVVSLTPPLKSAAIEPYAEKTTAENPLTEGVYRTIDDRLQKSANSAGQRMPGTHLKGREGRNDDRRGKSGRDSTGPGRRTKMGSKYKDMSPEQRQKMSERFKNMSPEQREKMRQQRQGGSK
jgi:hypothetical protein